MTLKTAKEKINLLIQGNAHKVLIGFLGRKFAGPERVERYIQSIERKKLFNKDSSPLKLFFRNEGEINISSPPQKENETKAEEIHHQ